MSMHDSLASFLDPIAKIWGSQPVLSQAFSLAKPKIANKINKKKPKKMKLHGCKPYGLPQRLRVERNPDHPT
jgi:hypothetical protein